MGLSGFIRGNVVGSCYSRPRRHTTVEIWRCKRREVVTARYCLTALQDCKLAVFSEASEIRHDTGACGGEFGAQPTVERPHSSPIMPRFIDCARDLARSFSS